MKPAPRKIALDLIRVRKNTVSGLMQPPLLENKHFNLYSVGPTVAPTAAEADGVIE
jgi:hypothetical protein